MNKKAVIIAEHDGQKIKPVTWELLAFAEEMNTLETCEICFCLLGKTIKTMAQDLSSKTGYQVICADHPDHYHGQAFKHTLVTLFNRFPADYIIAPHSTSGIDYAPALSIALNGSCITGVEEIRAEKSNWYFTRSLYGAKVQATFKKPDTDQTAPLVMTLAPGACKPLKPNKTAEANILHETIVCPDLTMTYKGQKPSPSQGSDLAKAQIIVSGGRGIEEEENYQLIEDLAAVFPRSATGASRPICDYGWAKYSQQIGATGTIISPKLYIACGISGATQHLEGIRDSQFIVAINTDPSAPIFQVADVCVIEDLTDFIPILIETLQNAKRPAN